MEEIALLNDTTGVMMSCAYTDHNIMAGLILGTGSNACYLENLDNVGKWNQPKNKELNNVIINTEWGAFGDDGELGSIITPYDLTVDKESLYPGKQMYVLPISFVILICWSTIPFILTNLTINFSYF